MLWYANHSTMHLESFALLPRNILSIQPSSFSFIPVNYSNHCHLSDTLIRHSFSSEYLLTQSSRLKLGAFRPARSSTRFFAITLLLIFAARRSKFLASVARGETRSSQRRGRGSGQGAGWAVRNTLSPVHPTILVARDSAKVESPT